MKASKFMIAIIAIIATGLLSFKIITASSVKGTIFPANGGLKAWAISEKDTFQSNIVNGSFGINNLKPGTYKIVIEAAAPYKNAVKEAVEVRTDEVTDVGEIRLEK